MNTALKDPRSETTRQRLIDTGLELFGRYGLDGVTTRQLATAAHVNQAAIPYHFGGKEGVYLAVAEQITAQISPRIQSLQNDLTESIEQETPEVLLLEITLKLADIAFSPEHNASWFIFLTREQFNPTPAANILHTGFMLPAHQLVSILLSRITGEAPESDAIILLTHAYLGQLINFVIGKATLSRRLNWPLEFGPQEWLQIKSVIARFSQATITGLTMRHAKLD